MFCGIAGCYFYYTFFLSLLRSPGAKCFGKFTEAKLREFPGGGGFERYINKEFLRLALPKIKFPGVSPHPRL